MDTYLIELTKNKAYQLLQDLEDLKIIKVLKREMHKKQPDKSSTAQFRGALKLSEKQYPDFQKHAKDIRTRMAGKYLIDTNSVIDSKYVR